MNEQFRPEIEKNVEKSTGHDVEIIASFRRHFDPKKNPEGMSLDELSDKGRQQSADLGPELSGKIKGYSSPKERAQDTIDIAFQNVDENADIINQRLLEEEQTETGRQFNIRIKKELDTVPGVKDLILKAMKLADKELKPDDEMTKYDFIIQYYLDHPEEISEPGGTPHEAAQDIAARVDMYRRMSDRLYDGSEVRLENATHGPKLEPFLQQVMIRREGDKQIRGFDNVMEIGGAFKPGENFETVIRKDEQGNETMFLQVRGQEYEIDMETVKTLAQEYKDRIKQQKTP
ncbi:MAG: hypothetical protein Q8P20_05040 [bacterium]|nr:hypothetical protein [bacterium]